MGAAGAALPGLFHFAQIVASTLHDLGEFVKSPGDARLDRSRLSVIFAPGAGKKKRMESGNDFAHLSVVFFYAKICLSLFWPNACLPNTYEDIAKVA